MAKVEAFLSAAAVTVTINDIPHLILRRADLSGVEAWEADSPLPYWCILFQTKHGTITCDYDSRELWAEILLVLRKSQIFETMQNEAER